MSSEKSLFMRLLSGAWRFVDSTRKVFLNLLFLAIVYLVVMSVLETGEELIVEPDTALVLQPQGNVVEQYSGTPLDYALQKATEGERTETRLRDLVDAVRLAANDDRIVRLVIDPSRLQGIGLASLLELDAAIADFKAAGKPVVALVDVLNQQQYFLSALADEVWLNPKGAIWIDGFAAYRHYFRDGLDKLEVEVNLFRVGKYKSAMEPWIRNDMSPEAREANLFWIGDLWEQYLEEVSRQRGIPIDNLSGAINQFADRLEAAGGDFSRLAMEEGLVDRLMSRPEANAELARLGAPGEGSEGFRQVDYDAYLAAKRMKQHAKSSRRIAIVVAEGEIVRGQQPQGTVGAATLAQRLREAGDDEDVKAVVLRINSPGGDAFAAERIRREVQAIREAGKTVVVSMGNVAASGGYWIAMGADEVWASPASITGSIGVYGMLPTFERPLEKLGIHTDGVGTTRLAGKLRLDRPLDPDLKRIFQHAVERTYDDFVQLVAGARKMSPDAVRDVAEGRVWSGLQAEERGLVDHTGTLQQAVDAAARIAGLGSDYEAEYQGREFSTFERFLLEMVGSSAVRSGLIGALDNPLRDTLLEAVFGDLEVLARSGNGMTIAAHCLCDAP